MLFALSKLLWAVLNPGNLLLLCALAGTLGLLSRRPRVRNLGRGLLVVGLGAMAAIAVLLACIAHRQDGWLFGGAVALAALLYLIGPRSRESEAWQARGRRVAVIGWLALVPFTLLLILAFDGVRPSLWGERRRRRG